MKLHSGFTARTLLTFASSKLPAKPGMNTTGLNSMRTGDMET